MEDPAVYKEVWSEFLDHLSETTGKKVQEAFFSFDWEGTALEEEFSKPGEAQFVPITFKNHWELRRERRRIGMIFIVILGTVVISEWVSAKVREAVL